MIQSIPRQIWKKKNNTVIESIPFHADLRVSSPKNENSVSIYSPSSCSKPLCVYLFSCTQRKIFGRMF